MKKVTILAAATSVALLLSAVTANADIRIRCEKRADRSVVSVDGNNLAVGAYAAQIISGTNQRTAPVQNSIGDEVEFDFSSQRNDQIAGATPIGVNFIQGGMVLGKILSPTGATIVSDTVRCRVR